MLSVNVCKVQKMGHEWLICVSNKTTICKLKQLIYCLKQLPMPIIRFGEIISFQLFASQ